MVAKVRKFRSSEGFEIIAGQNDASNDMLTFKIAGQNDLWFHVAGFPGSHVVLKCGGASSRTSVNEAAQVAVYFSKMRAGGKVAVSYCPVRNVKKPKGAKPGSVRIKGEKTVKVGANLPEEILDT